MKKSRKLKRRIFLAIVLAGLVAGGYSLTRKGSDTINVTVTQVGRGDITSTVTGTGRIHPELQVRISSEVAGEILELPVRDGSRIQRGDLILAVNPDTLEAQVNQQRAGLAAARSSSAQNRAEMLKAELDLRRTEELFERGFTSQEQLDQARTMLDVRRASYESSLHQIERQEMQLKEAQDLLGKARTYSPIDGTVVRVNAEVGDRVVGTGQYEGTHVATVANLDSMEVRIDVSESDIVHVQVGQRATIEVDALPNRVFSGTVSEISHSAANEASRSQEELTTFSVKVQFDDPSPQIRPGMTATAEIETDTLTDTLHIPLLAVVVRPAAEVNEAVGSSGNDSGRPSRSGARGGQRRVVFVVKDGIAYLRPVETGIADRYRIAITGGLEEGETVVTGSYQVLTRELRHQSEVNVSQAPRSPWERN
ncbi:MAG: efflux RND transporter periplasmic adaptor subunit [Opitutales bacterium]|nr:efflux RND transporter periplasmic adaptor subunit [Opitutales bacterium]